MQVANFIQTTGNQSLAGTKTFTGEMVAPSSAVATDGGIYFDSGNSKAYIRIGGTIIEITRGKCGNSCRCWHNRNKYLLW